MEVLEEKVLKHLMLHLGGKIGNIGGQQVVPLEIATITVPAGTWETVAMSWKTGGAVSKVWIADDFPFPIKAKTYTHVAEGIPPPEYDFELLIYENRSDSPFVGIESTANQLAESGCDTDIQKEIYVKKSSKNFRYQIHTVYGPEHPVQGCEIQFLVSFLKFSDETEFLNQVQYDIFVVDDNGIQTRSIAQEEGRLYLYSPSGQALIDFIVKEEPGTANYVVWVYGLSPDGVVPSGPSDYLQIEIPIHDSDGSIPVEKIPSWHVRTCYRFFSRLNGRENDHLGQQTYCYHVLSWLLRLSIYALSLPW